jgi:hypothetical protein
MLKKIIIKLSKIDNSLQKTEIQKNKTLKHM